MTKPNWKQTIAQHKHTFVALVAAAVCFAVFVLAWWTAVRGQGSKALSSSICDDYSAYTTVETSASQTFSYDDSLIAMAFVFGVEGEQPQGSLDLVVTDTDTGEVLAQSTGDMASILPGQYTGLGLDRTISATAGRSYTVTLTPHYEGSGRLSLGHSNGTALWQQNAVLDGTELNGTLALLITYRQIGGFLTRYYWLVAVLALAAVFFGVRSALRGKLALHRLVCLLVLVLGITYSFALPPYGAPDEKYHINQSFTLACRWANALSDEDWKMGTVPISSSYRREHDTNAALQDQENGTTVWAWQAYADNLFTLSPDSFDSHAEYQEAQTDQNPILYLPSAAAVFASFVLHLGFVPALALGRLANLICFALLAMAAIQYAPFGKRVFAAAALLPMTLHLAASFSRDALLLGLCFAFASLALQAGFGKEQPGRGRLLAMAVAGLLLCPGKAVYLPLAALVLWIPGKRLSLPKPAVWKAGFLAACVALTLLLNGSMLRFAVGSDTTVQPADDTAVTLSVNSADSQRAPHGAPDSAGSSTESTKSTLVYRADLAENTVENYVRRLFWYAEGTEPSDAETTFWADALRSGDTTAVELAQSFFFSPEAMESPRLSNYDTVRAMILCLYNLDPPEENCAGYAQSIPEKGLQMVFKELYGGTFLHRVFDPLGVTIGIEDSEHYPLDRRQLAEDVQQAAAIRESQSVATGEDAICYTPGYLLTHLPQAIRLLVNSVIQNGDHYLRTLVGGSLGYYTMDLAWFWVVALYLLLAWAVIPAAGELLPGGAARLAMLVTGLLCCALSVAGCLTWTPISYDTLYGLQGRYFLPVLPVLLAAIMPRRLQTADGQRTGAGLICALCVVNAGVLLNVMLSVLAL